MSEIYFNPNVKQSIQFSQLSKNPLEFHRKIMDYQPTPLVLSKKASSKLGFNNIWVKNESNRYGLPAFKILGASWAIYNEIAENLQIKIDDWTSFEELKKLTIELGDLTLTTATDGNHGRTVARVARWFGLKSKIFIPSDSATSRINAIRSEGAEVILVEGDYDLAVEMAAKESGEKCWIIQDTAYENYTSIPTRIVEGYSTIFWEVEEQQKELDQNTPEFIVIQIGVGSLASSLVDFYRNKERTILPKIIGVEPVGADCGLQSIKEGKIVTTTGPYSSIMAGMNCGTISTTAIKYLKEGIDAFVSVTNEKAIDAMRILAKDGIASGETGCAGLAGLLEIIEHYNGKFPFKQFGIEKDSNILIISTEGITDPVMYQKIIGKV